MKDINFQYVGHPFLLAGVLEYKCHQGRDINQKAKERRMLLLDREVGDTN